nr:pectinesterase family protein [Paenibacillus sp. Soil766]
MKKMASIKKMANIKKMISTALTGMMLLSSVPFYSETAEAAAALPYVENFESGWADGNFLTTFSGTSSGGSSISSVTVNNTKFTSTLLDANAGTTSLSDLNADVSASSNGTKALHLYDNVSLTKGNISALTTFALQTTGGTNMELDFLSNTLGSGGNGSARFRVANGANNKRPISIETRSGKLQYKDAAGAYADFSPALTFSQGTWYHLKLEINMSTSKYFITVTDQSSNIDYKANSIGFISGQEVTDIGGLDINTGDGAQMEIYVDNLNIYNATPPQSIVAAPSNVTAVNGNAQVNLTWNTVTDATYYNVKRGSVSGGPYTTMNASPITALNYTDSVVSNGQTYYYVVTAANATSESVNSTQMIGNPAVPATLATPTGLSANPGNNKVDLTWNSVTAATYYNVKRSTDGSTYTPIASNVTVTNYSDLMAVNGTTYYYVVNAGNATVGSADSSPASATPVAPSLPAAPANVAALAGEGQAVISWSGVAGATSYNVKRSDSAGGTFTTIANVSSGTNFTDTGLTNGIVYFYAVTAVNTVGESEKSSVVLVKPGNFLVNDNFETRTLGDLPAGYTPPFGSGVITAFSSTNNSTVINNVSRTNSYSNTSASIDGNASNVLWINDGPSRGGFNNAFTPVTADSLKGITAELRFMQAARVGDSYVLELLDSSKKIAVSFNINSSPVTIDAKTWYTVKYVADVKANTADLFVNGKYYGNVNFSTPVADIASMNFRMAGSSTGNAYVDDLVVYQQEVVTPQKVTTAGADKKVTLSWNPASGATSYNIYRSATAGGPYTLVANNITEPTYTNIELENKKEYFYVVTTVNANGESDYSNEAKGYPNNVTPPEQAPVFQSTDIRDSQLTLRWNDVRGKDDDGNEVATVYTLLRSTNPNGPFEAVAKQLSSTTYLEKGLNNGTDYYYQIIAENMGGAAPASELLKIAPAAPLSQPTLSGLPGNKKVDLNWSPVVNAAKYVIKRSEVNGGPYSEVGQSVTTSYTDAEVTNGTLYYYVVTAVATISQVNAIQESMISNQLKAVPYVTVSGAPNTPISLTASANEGSVSLSWGAVADASLYNVKRSTVSGESFDIVTASSTASYEDNSVTNGTTYYYVVSAVNASGESQNSDEIIVLPAKVLTVNKNATANGTTVFNTIQSAVNSVSLTNTARTIIHIMPGTYTEKLVVNRPYVSLVGSGMDQTRIVYGDYAGTTATVGQQGHVGNTFLSQTVDVNADYFTAANLTIENNAGPRSAVAQAVALSLKSDMAVFESVKLIGYQDTLYTGLNAASKGRHYFHNSIIQGDVDFIFGEAPAVVFDNVKMVLVSNSGGGGHITAAAQKNASDLGYVFLNSQIVDDASAQGAYDLGRPWKDYANVRFINTSISSNKFLSAGWIPACAGTCKSYSFNEYNSYGTGAVPAARQIAAQLTGQDASLTIPQMFSGWDPTVPVIMPKVNYLPSVSVASSSFDKNTAKQADIFVTLSGNGHELQSIENDSKALTASDYSVAGNIVTIKKSYLAELSVGTTTLTFHFDNIAIPLTISVLNTDGSDIGKQILAPNDGWASHTSGTMGGSTANRDNTFIVTNRSELVKAVAGNTPKIVYIQGIIDMNVDDNNNPIGMDYYKDPEYDFDAYLEVFDPAVWGKNTPSGALESARSRSATNQGNRIKITVGSNTTIVGLPGSSAKILGGNINLDKVDNIIIRNIEFQNTFDYFPQWDPNDGETGNWNSAYDNISVKGSTHVWIDRNTFSDDGGLDDQSHKYFGRKFQQHDGTVDITNASDLVTVSYNYFHDHDKTTLVGGSDEATGDAGKLRVTFHHNYYQNVGQRVPRVRFGQVHVYNNFYDGFINHVNYPYLYSIGVGYKSHVIAQNNYFNVGGATAASIIQVSPGGTEFTDKGSVLNGVPIQIAESKGGLLPASWTPTLYTSMNSTNEVIKVRTLAGAEDAHPSPSMLPALLSPEDDEISSGSSGGSGTGSTTSTITTSADQSSVTINAPAVKEQTAQGASILKVTIDAATWNKAIEELKAAAGGTPIIEVPVQGHESAGKVQLPSAALDYAQSKSPTAVIAVKFDTFTYNLPVMAIDTAILSEKLGVKPEDMTVTIAIEKVADSIALAVSEKSKQEGFTQVTETVDFSVSAQAGGKSFVLNDFDTYVARTFQITKPLDLKTLTAVMYDPATGSMSFVPAAITVVDGVTTVVLKRPGNSIYTIVQTTPKQFADLKGHWSETDVELLASKLVVQGVSEAEFAPNSAITRAEFAALLVRGLGLSEVKTAAYADVNTTDWFAGTVGAAVKAGLVDGFEDGTFRPGSPINREQMALMIARALTFVGKQVHVDNNALTVFADGKSISSWAKDAVAKSVTAGIINGLSGGTFKPVQQASRAEASVMLKRLLQAVEFIIE